MKVTPTELAGVMVLEPRLFADARGAFFESYNLQRLDAAVGREVRFVQDNQSVSTRNVLRGLHYQVGRPQGKLVRVIAGQIFDVAVDLRRSSSTFGRWEGFALDAQAHRQVWIPEGFAHGFLVLSETAEVIYKTTDYYAPEQERTIRWDDSALGIAWPLTGTPILSPKDAAGQLLADAEVFA
ncbi:MAG: dTDP-4-dehydrorhamnose 3,5-epimerase [Acidobacteriota bacterium]|nr:dTDP-4-dehydrorhamnose 3,5-epimerase [Acidobacteriota bacterium]